jgi:hypothetical protein
VAELKRVLGDHRNLHGGHIRRERDDDGDPTNSSASFSRTVHNPLNHAQGVTGQFQRRPAVGTGGLAMTADEWQAWTDPRPMLRYLLGTNYPRVQDVESFPDCRGSDRKLRLFACACYHRIRHLLPDPVARWGVEVAERYADGLATAADRDWAEVRVREPSDALEPRWRVSRDAERAMLMPTHEALALALIVLWPQAQKAAYYASSNASLAAEAMADSGKARQTEEHAQCGLLRDIFGNLRPVALDPAWRTSDVVQLARGIYDDRAFDRMPILADALMDAGCTSDDVLSHCRGSGPHVRGCWVVDLLLGKS